MAFPTYVDATWVNDAAVEFDAGELRRADAAVFAGTGANFGVRGGIVRHGDSSLSVTVNGSDVVTVQPGAVVIPGNAVSGTGCYRAAIGTSATGNLAARNATNPRIDLIVFRQLDTDVVGSHANYTASIEVVTGTPAATPSAPALPSMAVELARITVPATGGGTGTVDLTHRTYAAAIGGEIVVPTPARLPASAAKGQTAFALDIGTTYRWNGSAWVRGLDNCQIKATAIQSPSMPTATTGTVQFHSTVWDSNGLADLANNRIVIQTPGKYRLSGQVAYAQGATTGQGYRRAAILVNGVRIRANNEDASTKTGLATVVHVEEPVRSMAAGDLVTLEYFHSYGANLNTQADSDMYFSSLSAAMLSA